MEKDKNIDYWFTISDEEQPSFDELWERADEDFDTFMDEICDMKNDEVYQMLSEGQEEYELKYGAIRKRLAYAVGQAYQAKMFSFRGPGRVVECRIIHKIKTDRDSLLEMPPSLNLHNINTVEGFDCPLLYSAIYAAVFELANDNWIRCNSDLISFSEFIHKYTVNCPEYVLTKDYPKKSYGTEPLLLDCIDECIKDVEQHSRKLFSYLVEIGKKDSTYKSMSDLLFVAITVALKNGLIKSKFGAFHFVEFLLNTVGNKKYKKKEDALRIISFEDEEKYGIICIDFYHVCISALKELEHEGIAQYSTNVNNVALYIAYIIFFYCYLNCK